MCRVGRGVADSQEAPGRSCAPPRPPVGSKLGEHASSSALTHAATQTSVCAPTTPFCSEHDEMNCAIDFFFAHENVHFLGEQLNALKAVAEQAVPNLHSLVADGVLKSIWKAAPAGCTSSTNASAQSAKVVVFFFPEMSHHCIIFVWILGL